MTTKTIDSITPNTTSSLKAFVLGVGTELTTGQIVNRNASWISSQLLPYGISTCGHLTVPDEWDLILQGLKSPAAQQAQILFITGGLGPTSDDFTRKVIAEWIQKPLLYDESAWQHICERLNSRNITPKEIQKQQCYFPKDSQILENQQGTAHGFYLTHEKQHVFVLPGPPREIDAIWSDHIQNILEQQILTPLGALNPIIVKSWDFLGVPESEIAEWVEETIPNCPFEKAYRVHLPFVEFKFTFRQSEQKLAQPWLDKIQARWDQVLLEKNKSILIHSGKTEWVSEWILKYKPNIHFIFHCQNSYLPNIVLPIVSALQKTTPLQWQMSGLEYEPAYQDILIQDTLIPNSLLKPGTVVFSLFINTSADYKHTAELKIIDTRMDVPKIQHHHLTAPFSGLKMQERAFGFFTEMAFYVAL